MGNNIIMPDGTSRVKDGLKTGKIPEEMKPLQAILNKNKEKGGKLGFDNYPVIEMMCNGSPEQHAHGLLQLKVTTEKETILTYLDIDAVMTIILTAYDAGSLMSDTLKSDWNKKVEALKVQHERDDFDKKMEEGKL